MGSMSCLTIASSLMKKTIRFERGDFEPSLLLPVHSRSLCPDGDHEEVGSNRESDERAVIVERMDGAFHVLLVLVAPATENR